MREAFYNGTYSDGKLCTGFKQGSNRLAAVNRSTKASVPLLIIPLTARSRMYHVQQGCLLHMLYLDSLHPEILITRIKVIKYKSN